MTKWNVADAFAFFDGAECTNVNWSWSARNVSGSTVVLSLWQHLFKYKIYSNFGQPDFNEWIDKKGNAERVQNLKWARDHCNGIFRAVIVQAKDPAAKEPTVAYRCPQPNIVMRLLDLNELTGEFRAEILAAPGYKAKSSRA